MDKNTRLYSQNDQASNAWMVEGAQFSLGYMGLEGNIVSSRKAILGVAEMLADSESGEPRSRAFDLYCTAESCREVSSDELMTMQKTFDGGYLVNESLSLTLVACNELYVSELTKLSSDLSHYEKQSVGFAALIEDLATVDHLNSLEFLRTKKEQWKKLDIYKDGHVFGRHHRLWSIALSASKISPFTVKFAKNSEICREGQTADCMYVLLQGRIAVTKSGRYLASIEKEGQGFGEVALFLDGRRSASLTAEEDSVLYRIPKDGLKQFFDHHNMIFRNMAVTTSLRIFDTFERLTTLHKLQKSNSECNRRLEEGRDVQNYLLDFSRESENPFLIRVLSNYQPIELL